MRCCLPRPALTRFHVLLIGALLANAASAQTALVLVPPTPHAIPASSHLVRLSCERQRCLSLHVSRRWLAAARLVGASTVAPASFASVAPPQPGRAAIPMMAPTVAPLGLGTHVALRDGRALDLQLTPTPTRCAPLFSLRY